MSAVEALLRPDLRGFGGYASAAGRGFGPRIRLDANESPWANAADAGARLRCGKGAARLPRGSEVRG